MKMLCKALIPMMVVSAVGFAKSESPAGVFDIDAAHSKVGFEIPHLVISTVEGHFNTFEGKIELAKKFEDSKVTAQVDVESINTSNGKRDEHLRSADFFDVKKFPKMTFQSQKIVGTTAGFKMTGPLTLKGVTKQVTFDAKFLGSVPDGFGNEKVAFVAKAKLNRKDFGLSWNNMIEAGPVVGDEVTIELKIEAGRPIVKQALK